ncbi:translocation/assembly module TamB domain-containing protein [Pseudochrobactrum algeriensis]|uniref:translocation/assembly module TamB domain-containing protein n=1 Tax=Pseudochrobactrum algeriensis TaxID=2834768 RepID=UPI003B75C3B2
MNRFLAFVATFFIILPLGIYIGASLLPQGADSVTTPATGQSNPAGSGTQTAQADNPVSTQEAEEEKSYFLSFVEEKLSGPNRKISITGIEGVLSSEAKVGAITVADREGIWLRIKDAQLVWSRLALLRGRLSVDTLSAKEVEFIRTPLPDEGLPSPEAGGFALPELPLAVLLGELNIERLKFGQPVFGLASEVALKGNLTLQDGSLESLFDMQRLDGPGGTMKLKANYANADQKLDLDMRLSEPANGIAANLLNIAGKPPVELALTGAGKLDDLKVDLTLDADSQRILTGLLTLNRNADGTVTGRVFNADVKGPIAALIPEKFRDFFGATSSLAANGFIKDGGGFRLDNFNLSNAALQVQAKAETANDGFLTRLNLDALIADQEKGRVLLPVSGGQTSLASARLTLDYGDRQSADWTGKLLVEGLQAGDFSAQQTVLDMGGAAENLQDAQNRHVGFNITGNVTGINARQPEVAQALGDRFDLAVLGQWRAGSPVQLEKLQLTGNGLSAALKGAIDKFIYTGDIVLQANSLMPFSALADRSLAGSLDLKATGTVALLTGGFDLTLDGTAENIKTGEDIADRIINGRSTLSGGLARSENGFSARGFRIGNDANAITANGSFSSKDADFDLGVEIGDIADLSDKATGPLSLKASARGTENRIALAARASVPSGSLEGRKLNDGLLDFNAVLDGSDPKLAPSLSGGFSGSAFLGGEKLDLAGKIALDEQGKRLSDLSFVAGGTRVSGDLNIADKNLLAGRLKVDAPDVSTAAALFLAKATGSINADIDLSYENDRQNAAVKADIRNLNVEGNVIGQADINATLADLFNVPVVDGTVKAQSIRAGTFEINVVDATAQSEGSKTVFQAATDLKIGTKVKVNGALEPQDSGLLLSLSDAELRQGSMLTRLAQPASLALKGSDVTFNNIIMQVGEGRLSLNGALADRFNLDVKLDNLPLNVANSIQPDLGLGGLINGQAKVTGSRNQPDVSFDINARDVIARQTREMGIGALNATAKGTSSQNRLKVDSRITGGNGLDTRVNGFVPLGTDKSAGALDVNVELANLPLALLNGVVKDQNLGGNVTGTAKVTGALTNPAAEFNLNGRALSAKPLAENGLAPLNLKAAGRYGDKTVNISSLSVDGPQNLSVTAQGRVPLSGSGLGIDVTGQIPLALANRFLSDRGAQATGTLALTANVSGGFDNPQIRGMFSTSGAQMVDPETNIRLNNITINGSMEGQTIRLRNASAALSTGGSINADGTISINAAQNFPADLRINFDKARYADGSMVVATINGGLTITGPLMRDPLIAGKIEIERAEITVPESFGGGGANIDVRHVNTPASVLMTLQRAKVETRAKGSAPVPTSRPTVPQLDVRVIAPNQIFVRGRGLDTELGGAVRLTGPVTNVRPVGGFELLRGRLDILTQRVTFDEGRVTLIGDMNPQLYFVARSDGGDIIVLVTVQGTVDNPDIKFSSEPELPQDEVLARLIFKRSISELSPFQIAQLAAAAAELAGGKNANLLGALRQGVGLDDLDVVTDSKGNAAVRAGSYIRDNIYLGVEASGSNGTKGTINLDITRDLKAKGSVGTNGDSGLGVFYEKDY